MHKKSIFIYIYNFKKWYVKDANVWGRTKKSEKNILWYRVEQIRHLPSVQIMTAPPALNHIYIIHICLLNNPTFVGSQKTLDLRCTEASWSRSTLSVKIKENKVSISNWIFYLSRQTVQSCILFTELSLIHACTHAWHVCTHTHTHTHS